MLSIPLLTMLAHARASRAAKTSVKLESSTLRVVEKPHPIRVFGREAMQQSEPGYDDKAQQRR
jgi:hypothetical protein